MGRERLSFDLTSLEYFSLIAILLFLHAILQLSAVLHRDVVAWEVLSADRAEENANSRTFHSPVREPVASLEKVDPLGNTSNILPVILLVLVAGGLTWFLVKKKRGISV